MPIKRHTHHKFIYSYIWQLNSQTNTNATHQQCRKINQTTHEQENQDMYMKKHRGEEKTARTISVKKISTINNNEITNIFFKTTYNNNKEISHKVGMSNQVVFGA